MKKKELEMNIEKVCNLRYLAEIMGEKKYLIKEIIDVFLKQVPEELKSMNEAITKADFAHIKRVAHLMKSTVSVMGIAVLAPILQEMEDLGGKALDMQRLNALNRKLNLICRMAIQEIKKEKQNYI